MTRVSHVALPISGRPWPAWHCVAIALVLLTLASGHAELCSGLGPADGVTDVEAQDVESAIRVLQSRGERPNRPEKMSGLPGGVWMTSWPITSPAAMAPRRRRWPTPRRTWC